MKCSLTLIGNKLGSMFDIGEKMSDLHGPLLWKGNEMSYDIKLSGKMMNLRIKVTMLNPTKDITIKHKIIWVIS